MPGVSLAAGKIGATNPPVPGTEVGVAVSGTEGSQIITEGGGTVDVRAAVDMDIVIRSVLSLVTPARVLTVVVPIVADRGGIPAYPSIGFVPLGYTNGYYVVPPPGTREGVPVGEVWGNFVFLTSSWIVSESYVN